MNDCEHLSALGDDPDTWDGLDGDYLKQVISVKFIEYGATEDGSRIANLVAIYRHAVECLDVSESLEMRIECREMIEQHEGLGHVGLMMFLVADTNPGIHSSAALSLSVFFDSKDGDKLAGPRFVINTLVNHGGEHRDKIWRLAASCCRACVGHCPCWQRPGKDCPKRRS